MLQSKSHRFVASAEAGSNAFRSPLKDRRNARGPHTKLYLTPLPLQAPHPNPPHRAPTPPRAATPPLASKGKDCPRRVQRSAKRHSTSPRPLRYEGRGRPRSLQACRPCGPRNPGRPRLNERGAKRHSSSPRPPQGARAPPLPASLTRAQTAGRNPAAARRKRMCRYSPRIAQMLTDNPASPPLTTKGSRSLPWDRRRFHDEQHDRRPQMGGAIVPRVCRLGLDPNASGVLGFAQILALAAPPREDAG